MFGYVKPFKPELKMREFDAYKAVYCGLCYQLGKSFGPLARLTLSYDFTFLNMVASAVLGEALVFEERRCCANPLKKVHMCVSGEACVLSADIAAIMIYHKLLDNIQDRGLFKGTTWRLLLPFANRAHKKASKARPEAARLISEQMERQKQTEQRQSTVTDEACEPSALMMEGVFSLLSGDSSEKRVLGRMGYLLGRYIYLCDAIDDFEDDIKSGNYNPLVLKYGAGDEKSKAALIEGARESLFLTIGEIAKTCDLLDLECCETIIRNVTDIGLRAGVEEILHKKEKIRNG